MNTDEHRSWLRFVALCSAMIIALPGTVAANKAGIFGASGRFGGFCTPACHTGGDTPLVEFETPEGLEFGPGAIATFRFKITSQDRRQTHAGLDVAVSGGTLSVSDPGTRLIGFAPNLEVTHNAPRENDPNDVAVFEFKWTAPATPGIYTVFAAGNSVNFDDKQTGDSAARTTLAISVVSLSTPTPTATDTPVPTDTETPTATPTNPTVEATPTPTSQGGGGCTGDCDSSDSVTVDEIVRGVNIALGNRPVEDCLKFDRDDSGTVTVDEIVDAIANALNGCA